jgi:uncharacterized membrane protein (GlpM family)
MELHWDKVLPVLISILVIIIVAVMQEYSRFFAAITATAPLGATLAMFIVYFAEGGKKETMSDFNKSMLLGSLPSLLFLLVAWWAARQGYKLAPVMAMGYASWGFGLGLLMLAR